MTWTPEKSSQSKPLKYKPFCRGQPLIPSLELILMETFGKMRKTSSKRPFPVFCPLESLERKNWAHFWGQQIKETIVLWCPRSVSGEVILCSCLSSCILKLEKKKIRTMLRGGLDSLTCSLSAALLLMYFWAAQFSPQPLSLYFLPFSIFCCLVMAQQTDGAFSDSGFDHSECPVSSYFVDCHRIWCLGCMMVTLWLWSLRLPCQIYSCSRSKRSLMSAVLLRRFFHWWFQKGYSRVQGQQHRLNKCLFSTEYRYYVCERRDLTLLQLCYI